MGFSHVVASGILFAGVALVAFDYTDQVYDNEEELIEAWEFARERDMFLAHTDMAYFQVHKVPDDIEMVIDNTGSTVLDLSKMHVFFDGEPKVILSWNVDGQATNVWPPGARAYILVDQFDLPTDIYLVTAEGYIGNWR